MLNIRDLKAVVTIGKNHKINGYDITVEEAKNIIKAYNSLTSEDNKKLLMSYEIPFMIRMAKNYNKGFR